VTGAHSGGVASLNHRLIVANPPGSAETGRAPGASAAVCRSPGQPFFAQIQIYPPHRPFPRDPVEPERLEGLVLPPYYPEHPLVRRDWAAYLLGVEELDRAVGAALDALEESGQAENTIARRWAIRRFTS